MFQALALPLQKLVDARFGIPVLDHVQPTVIAQQYARIVLHPLALVVAKVLAFQPKQLVESLAGRVHVADREADVLHSNDGTCSNPPPTLSQRHRVSILACALAQGLDRHLCGAAALNPDHPLYLFRSLVPGNEAGVRHASF